MLLGNFENHSTFLKHEECGMKILDERNNNYIRILFEFIIIICKIKI